MLMHFEEKSKVQRASAMQELVQSFFKQHVDRITNIFTYDLAKFGFDGQLVDAVSKRHE